MNFSIEVKNFSKACDKKSIFKDASFKIKPGICSLIGPNGAGKSTILNSLIGLVFPTKGEIIIDNQTIDENPHSNQSIRFVPAEPAFTKRLKSARLPEIRGIFARHSLSRGTEEIRKIFFGKIKEAKM